MEVAQCLERVRKHAQVLDVARSTYRPAKRPRVVLDEDTYVASLAAVIKRNFFPPPPSEGDVSTRNRSLDGRGLDTQTTPPHSSNGKLERDVQTLSLEAFQARYTSEDNASFLEILDRANLERRERYHWLYTSRSVYAGCIEGAPQGEQRRIAGEKERLLLEPAPSSQNDERPTVAEKSEGAMVVPRDLRNGLMHNLDQDSTLQDKPPAKYSISEVRVHNLRVPETQSRGSGTLSDGAMEREVRAGQAYLEQARYKLLPDTDDIPVFGDDEDVRDEKMYEVPATSRREQVRDRLAARLKRASTPVSSSSSTRRSMHSPRGQQAKARTPQNMLSPAARRLLSRSPALRTPLIGERAKVGVSSHGIFTPPRS